ncbi:MAG: peptidylprolyl isomerase, partial [Bdellovibrionales bacterium]|nr:peptidylprolyl isomerase [Bdellovibrionales bacterium]
MDSPSSKQSPKSSQPLLGRSIIVGLLGTWLTLGTPPVTLAQPTEAAQKTLADPPELAVVPARSASARDEDSPSRGAAQVVAEVNGIKLYKRDVDAELALRLGASRRLFTDDELHKLRRQLLRNMIDRRLLLTAARRAYPDEPPAPASEVQPTSPASDKPSGELVLLERQLQDDKLIARYLNEKVFSNISIHEDEMTAEFLRAPHRFVEPLELHIREIVLFLQPEMTEEERAQQQALAERIAAQAQGNKNDFSRLARTYSEAASRPKGGDRGFVTRNQLPAELADAVF